MAGNVPYKSGMRYREYVSGLSARDYVSDWTLIDDKADFIGYKIDEIQEAIYQLGLGTGGAVTTGRISELVFKYTIPVISHYQLSEDAPFNGHITEVLRHYPLGCNALVDIAVGYADEQFLPNSGHVALDDVTTRTTNLSIPVVKGNPIWVDLINSDSTNAHTITVTVVVMESVQ